jgi:hypothetical protein
MVGLNEYEINRILSQEARDAAYLNDSNMKRMAVAICKALAKTIAANNKKIDMDIKLLVRGYKGQ